MQPLRIVGLSLAVFFGMAFWSVTAQVEEQGLKFQIAAQANTGNVWVLNTRTGQLRLCLPPEEQGQAAECFAWSE